MESDSSEPELAFLVLRAQLGDKDAFNDLFLRVTPPLSAYLRSMVADGVEAEDLLQEVFLIVYRKIRWLHDPAHFRAWVYRIAAREALRAARRQRGRAQTQLTDEEWNVVRQRTLSMEHKILGSEVLQELMDVPPAGRAVLCLHYLEGLSIDEAAMQLEIPFGTAKSRLAFGLGKLRKALGLDPRGGPKPQ